MMILKQFFFFIFDPVFSLPFLVAQKKRPDAINAMQKTPALNKVRILKKIGITLKNTHF